MLPSLVYLVVRGLLGPIVPEGQREAAKDLEIVVLRHQLNVLRRQVKRPHSSLSDRLFLRRRGSTTATDSLVAIPRNPNDSAVLAPGAVRSKWARYNRRPGRPPLPAELRQLILRLATKNPRWGYRCIQGELQKLGIKVSTTAIRNLLVRRGLGPAPRRGTTTWRQLLAQQASSMVACDFFTVETEWLKRIYVLVFIEFATRRVHLAGCTTNPDGAWVDQQARNFTLPLDERHGPFGFLIHDRDAKFSVLR
jgi:putative transposase